MTTVSGLPAARAVAASSSGYYGISCAALLDGTVRCWGRGYGNTPVAVPGVTGVASITAGTLAFSDHVCVRLNDDGVRCWGSNNEGQLGTAGAAPPTARTPVTPRGLWRVTGVYAGGGHTCATQIDGAVFCWGSNRMGQVGDGTAESRDVPTPVIFPR
ncbi:MAG: hypothetical protein IPF99_30050 [Deltaproteobacteria bacterium]|nr:hypothetical protein [Deltaproteobacteria bacterium]